MYGIYLWVIFRANVGKYSKRVAYHGHCGMVNVPSPFFPSQDPRLMLIVFLDIFRTCSYNDET